MGEDTVQRRVLVVDDEPGVLATLEAILSDTYDVTCAASAEDALRLLPTGNFDAVCTDYAMGGAMNGVQLLESVSRLSPHCGKILVTGQHEIGDSAGMYYVLVKPCQPQRLLDLIERAVAFSVARRKIATATAEARRTGKHATGPRRAIEIPAGLGTEGPLRPDPKRPV